VAKGPIMSERRLPNRDRHRVSPVLSFTEQDGVSYFCLSPPVHDTGDMEAETTEHQS